MFHNQDRDTKCRHNSWYGECDDDNCDNSSTKVWLEDAIDSLKGRMKRSIDIYGLETLLEKARLFYGDEDEEIITLEEYAPAQLCENCGEKLTFFMQNNDVDQCYEEVYGCPKCDG